MCRHVNILYGLKQAPRKWYKKIEHVMSGQGCMKTTNDHCVFVRIYLFVFELSCYYILMACLLLVNIFYRLIG